MSRKPTIFFLMVYSCSSIANECDCTQIIGSCQGSINVSPTKSSVGLAGAKLTFRANANQCAKIEYWVDNTQELTVLPNGKYGEDSVWSAETKPFQPYRVTYKSCMICKTETQKNKEREQQKLTEADTQSAIENLVNEASSNGSLEPSTYYSSSSASSGGTSNDSIDAITSLQSNLSNLQRQQQSKSKSEICNDNSDKCYCAKHGGVRCFTQPTIVNPK